jgi:exosortase
MIMHARPRITIPQLAAALALATLGAFAVGDAWLDILHIAQRDEESSHIFLVPVIAVMLVCVRRRRLAHVRPAGQWIGPAFVASGATMYAIGDAALWQSVYHFGAILVTVGCLLTVLGSQIVRHMLPAFLVLVFLIPIPGRVRQRVAIPMQNATARVTQSIFDVVDTSVTRSGNLLKINGVEVAIAEACNGLRMVFALVLVCYAFAFGTPLRLSSRLLILAISPLAAIVCNVIRLVPTVYVYGNYSAKFADEFHTISGWVMLFVAFFILLGVLRLMRWALIPAYRFTLAYD